MKQFGKKLLSLLRSLKLTAMKCIHTDDTPRMNG